MSKGAAMSETEKDIHNVEAWTHVIEDVLWPVPLDVRAEIMAMLAKRNEEARKEVEAHGGFVVISFDPASNDEFMQAVGRYWSAAMRLRSLVVQILTRRISNNHSPERAAELLYAQHRYGQGSRMLQDYLPEDQ
jgi:hypothetical protein